MTIGLSKCNKRKLIFTTVRLVKINFFAYNNTNRVNS